MSNDKIDDTLLEKNVEQLLTTANDPPRLSTQARAKIFAELKARTAAPVVERPVIERPVIEHKPVAKPAAPRRRRSVVRTGLSGVFAAAAIVALVWGISNTPPGVKALMHENRTPQAAPVELADGSKLLLGAGAQVTEIGPRHLKLARGQLLLDVAPRRDKAPFVVETPEGRVVVLGTRFVLATAAGETRAAVVRGSVRLEGVRGQEVLHAGEEGVLSAGARPERRPAPRLSYLTSWTRDAETEGGGGDEPIRNGNLLAREPRWGQEWPLEMRQLTVDVHVENEVVRTTIDQTFFNHVDRQLEGVYSFPLPPGAAVSRLAMYVDGTLMEGGIVERQRGRDVYEGIVYQRRDPALLEWMQGNTFKVRIFPLPARSEKRIILSYTQPLERLYDTARLVVPIPAVDQPVRDVKFAVRVVDGAGYEIQSSSHVIETAEDGEDRLVSYKARGEKIGTDLVLTLRSKAATAPITAGLSDEEWEYLMLRVQPDIDAGAARSWKPRRWVVLFDTSASRDPLDLQAQSYVLRKLLEEWDEEDEVAIVAFDTTTRLLRGGFRKVADADRQEITDFLADESQGFVGDTDLGAALEVAAELLATAADGGSAADPFVLYLGDGVVTHGDADLDTLRAAIAGRATFVGVAVGDRVDARTMRALADETGGAHAVWSGGEDLGWHAFDLIAALNTPRAVGVRATLLDGEGQELDNALIYASAEQIADGEQLTVLARLPRRVAGPGPMGTRAASLRLDGTIGGKSWRQESPIGEITGDAKYLPRLWAQSRVEDLMRRGDDQQEEITKLGMEHFLITPHTSLLVLENDAMYKEFKVNRGDPGGWAFYPAPKKIPVVHEPHDTLRIDGEIDPELILVRTPIAIFPTLEDQGYFETTTIAVSASGQTRRRSADAAQFAGSAGVRGGAVRLGMLGDDLDDRKQGMANEESIDVVTTGQLRDGHRNRTWHSAPNSTVTRGEASGKMVSGPMRAPMGGGDFGGNAGFKSGGRFAGEEGKAERRALAKDKSQRYSGYDYYNGYGYNAIYPTALYYSSDPRLDDLTEFVPALFADASDLERERLLRRALGRDPGKMSDAAKALLDEAWRRRTTERYTFADGETLVLDADGHFLVERVGASKLAEQVVYDGTDLINVYPELGIAVRRHIGVTEPALLSHWAPFALPRAEHLARWYDVAVVGDRTIRLTAAGAKDATKEAEWLELELDPSYRLVAARRAHEGKVVATQKFEWSADALTVIDEAGTRTKLARDARVGAVDAVDTKAFTVVEMQLAQPAYWAAKATAATAGSAAWLTAQHQLLASYAALGDESGLVRTFQAIVAFKGAKASRGEVALAARGLRYLAKKDLTAALSGLGADDPVAAYVRAASSYYQNYRSAPLDAVAKAHPGTLVGMLASYRALLNRAEGYNGGGYYNYNNRPAARVEARKRILAFAKDYGYSTFRFLSVWAYTRNYQWQDTDAAVELWDSLAEVPEWRAYAQAGAAAALYAARKYDEAAKRYEAAFHEAEKLGEYPVVDYAMYSAFVSSTKGQAGWRLFWTRHRASVMRSGDAKSLASFLQSCAMNGQHQDVGPVLGAFRGKQIDDVDTAAHIATLLQNLGRPDDAWAVLRPLVDGAGKDDPWLVERASYLAEGQGRIEAAARYQERALELRAEEPMALDTLRQHHRRLFTLRARLAQSLEGGGAADVHVAAALASASRWRRDDPDNVEIDRLTASLLFALGREKDAWRQLSTAIERHPAEGSAYGDVAGVLENEGALDEADAVWRRAVRVEPTNPVWLYRRSQNLMALGREPEARELLHTIVKGKWQDRFSDTVRLAKDSL